MSLKQDRKDWQQRVDSCLEHWLPKDNIEPEILHKAMRYAVFNGGKRIRPILVDEGPMSPESLGEEVLDKIRSRKYAMGIVPYNTDHGGFYGNIHALLKHLADCRFIGIGTDGSLHEMWWLAER